MTRHLRHHCHGRARRPSLAAFAARIDAETKANDHSDFRFGKAFVDVESDVDEDLPPEPDVSAMTLAALDDELGTLAGNQNAANYRLLRLIAEMDRRDPWAKKGFPSCAHYLNWRCGIALGPAREKVRTARALKDLPLIGEQFRRGRLSYSKVRALTRAANADNEEVLLQTALHGTATQVDRVVSHYLQTLAVTDPLRCLQKRMCTTHWDDNGMLVIHARLCGEQGAVFLEALEHATGDIATEEAANARERAAAEGDLNADTGSDEYSSENAHDRAHDVAGEEQEHRFDHPADDSDATAHRARQRADGLARMSEAALENHGGTGHAADRYMVNIDVPAQTLAARSAADVMPENLPVLDHDGPPLSIQTLHRLCCDASVVFSGEPGHAHSQAVLGDEFVSASQDAAPRRTRTIPAWLRRTLQRRDGGCRFPGCTHSRFVDAHHIVHWAKGGETEPDNLVLLCRRHHVFVHEYGYQIEVERSPNGPRFRFFEPDTHVEVKSAGDWRSRGSVLALFDSVAQEGIKITTDTALSGKVDTPADLDLILTTYIRQIDLHRHP